MEGFTSGQDCFWDFWAKQPLFRCLKGAPLWGLWGHEGWGRHGKRQFFSTNTICAKKKLPDKSVLSANEFKKVGRKNLLQNLPPKKRKIGTKTVLYRTSGKCCLYFTLATGLFHKYCVYIHTFSISGMWGKVHCTDKSSNINSALWYSHGDWNFKEILCWHFLFKMHSCC